MAIEFYQQLSLLPKAILSQVIQVDSEVMDFPWGAKQWEHFLSTEASWMLVTQCEAQTLKGFALFQLSDDDWSHLLKIGVAQEYKRCGIARHLLEKSLDRLKNDYKTCSLEVREDNLAAISLYNRFDFNMCFPSDRFLISK